MWICIIRSRLQARPHGLIADPVLERAKDMLHGPLPDHHGFGASIQSALRRIEHRVESLTSSSSTKAEGRFDNTYSPGPL